MATPEGTVTEDVASTIALSQDVYDKDGKKVGLVDNINRRTGYFMVNVAPFYDHDLYIPFHLITTIDRFELFLSLSREELKRDYTAPPPRSTEIVGVGPLETATTTEPSGYTGAPVVVERVKLDQLRKAIAVGDHVYTSDQVDLGTIKRYDAVTGWMLVERGPHFDRRDLMVPVTVVDDVVDDANEVYLVASEADLQGLQPAEPVDVVFTESQYHNG